MYFAFLIQAMIPFQFLLLTGYDISLSKIENCVSFEYNAGAIL